MKDDVQDSQNKMLAQQRHVLRAILDEGEQKVPSTTASIMAAIQQGQRTPQETSVDANNHRHELVPIVPFPQKREIETPRPRRTRHTLYSALAFVAIAVALIVSFGLFSSLSAYRSTSTSGGAATNSNPATTITRYPPFVPGTTITWSAVIITYKVNGTTVIANYSPTSGKYATLATSQHADTFVDGVSHKGHMVLYSVYDGLKTAYYVYPQSTTDPIYTVPDKSSSAVWSTDDHYIFISTTKGIARVDVQAHTVTLILPALAVTKLLNYRDNDGYLYFVRGYKGQAYASEGTLNRINVSRGVIQQITPCERGTNFWLSPSGVTVYYTCPDQDATLLYAVHSDGANPYVFSAAINNVIGYMNDGSPLALVHVNGKYQVVQQDLNTSQNTVLLGDIAPGATTIMENDVAVAPSGHALVAKGTYSGNGTTTQEQFWYSDLATGKSQLLKIPQGARTSQVIGWDRLQVLGDMLTSTP